MDIKKKDVLIIGAGSSAKILRKKLKILLSKIMFMSFH